MSGRKIVFYAAILLFIFGWLGFVRSTAFDFFQLASGTKSWKPAVTIHAIPENPHFEEIWSLTAFIDCMTCLATEADNIYLTGGLRQNSTLSLISLDSSTGQLEWRQLLNTRDASPLWVTSGRIYVGQDGSQKIGSRNQMWGAARIVSFDRESGDEMWSQRIPGANGVRALGATEDIVSAVGNYYHNLVAFDANTGDPIKSELDGIAMQFEAENLLYLYQTNGLIQAFDRSSGEMLWQRNPSIGSFASSDGVLLIKSDEVGTVTALNSLNGEILWSWSGVIGNVTASNGVAYFLGSTGSDLIWGGDIVIDIQLTAVDVKTGAILGTLSFEPGGIQSGGGNYSYNVAANGDIILVYLGDGRQLFALRLHR